MLKPLVEKGAVFARNLCSYVGCTVGAYTLHSCELSVVLGAWQIQVLLFVSYLDFFFNIFKLRLVASMNAKPADVEGWLYLKNNGCCFSTYQTA